MKSIVRLMIPLVCFFCMDVSAIANNGNHNLRIFSEFGCSLRLPVKGHWQWIDPKSGPEHTIAYAKSNDGMLLMLVAERQSEAISLDDKKIAEYEQEVVGKPNLRKITGKKIEFMGVPAYELNFAQMDTKEKAFTRLFIENHIEYGLFVIVPKGIRFNRTLLEQIYKGFSWSKIDESPSRKDKHQKGKQGTFTYLGPQDYKKFPHYHCKLRLPNDNTWEWGEQDEVLALAERQDGMKLQLVVMTAQDTGVKRLVFNDEFIKGFEKGLLNRPGMQKISSQKTNFKGLEAYQMSTLYVELDIWSHSRIFIKHNKVYMLQIIIPESIFADEEMLESIFNSFSWTETQEEISKRLKEEKEALRKSFVFEEDTTPDETVYTVTDAKTHHFKKGNITGQIDISQNKFIDNNSKPSYAFFNIEAKKEVYTSIRPGYITNLPVNFLIFAKEKTLEAAVQQCKEKFESEHDTLLVKEVKGTATDEGNLSVTLLLVSSFRKNEKTGKYDDPDSYRAFQFIQFDEYVVEIDVMCAQGMFMDRDYKTMLNNTVQSALRSLKINGKPVDTTVLARHVKKR